MPHRQRIASASPAHHSCAPTSIDVSDLVGTPYLRGGWDRERDGGIDCYGAACEVLRRLGLDLPRDREAAAFASVADGGGWRRVGREVGDATELGDLVLTHSEGAPAGVLVVAESGARRRLLTALPVLGVVLLRPPQVRRVLGVYRHESLCATRFFGAPLIVDEDLPRSDRIYIGPPRSGGAT